MLEKFETTGGGNFGMWFHASWPFVKIIATKESFTVSSPFNKYEFTPDQIVAIEECVWFPLLAWGIKIKHCVSN